jgi:tRNA (adenine57-N1/adenine58-N1)-methyltransferase
MPKIKQGDTLLLVDAKGRSIIVTAGGGRASTKLGVFDLDRLVGLEYGSTFRIGDAEFHLLSPSNEDVFRNLERKAQIITPKDAAQMVFRASIHPGATVVEGGSGSGALTIWLARAVGPSGKVYSYDVKEEHLRIAKRNIDRFGLTNVLFVLKDVCTGIDQTEVDAVVLDIPEPWRAVDAAMHALAPGGHMVCFVPTYNQIEQTVRAMRSSLSEVRAFELIEREVHVGESSARPDGASIGHTGFIAVGRKIKS